MAAFRRSNRETETNDANVKEHRTGVRSQPLPDPERGHSSPFARNDLTVHQAFAFEAVASA